MLDVMGALMIRAIILVIMMTVTVSLNDALYYKVASRSVQSELKQIADIMGNDFRKIGYHTIAAPISVADSSRITFRSDITNTDSLYTVSYFLSDTTSLGSTPNPEDRLLYRTLNTVDTLVVGAGITQFSLKYYDAVGNATADTSLVYSVGVQLVLEHGYFTVSDNHGSEFYLSARWGRRFFPGNL